MFYRRFVARKTSNGLLDQNEAAKEVKGYHIMVSQPDSVSNAGSKSAHRVRSYNA